MSNKTIDALVYCPFYICEAKTTITCEGIIRDKTVNQFLNESQKKEHEENFCVGRHCAGCGVFASIMFKYNPPVNNASAVIRH